MVAIATYDAKTDENSNIFFLLPTMAMASYLVCHKRNFYISFSANHDRQSVTVETPIKNEFLFFFRFPSQCPSMPLPYNACDTFQATIRTRGDETCEILTNYPSPNPNRHHHNLFNESKCECHSFISIQECATTFTQSRSLSLRLSVLIFIMTRNSFSFWRFLCQHPSISYFR